EAQDVTANEEVQDETANEEAQDVTANEEAQDVTANEEAQDENANEEVQDETAETGSETDGECCGDEECDSDKAAESAESCGEGSGCADADAADADTTADTAVDATAGDVPVASLEMLFMTHHTQAMMALGMPDPMTGETSANKDVAKFHIDMLSVIEEKTKGNLTSEESKALSSILHQLRMAFFAS
ncbi:MAG: DUF1844 domain-containing protein, partial [Pirellulaceae bacterium]